MLRVALEPSFAGQHGDYPMAQLPFTQGTRRSCAKQWFISPLCGVRRFARAVAADKRGMRTEADFDISKGSKIFDARALKLH